MNNPYDLHSWSTRYREDALQEANRRHPVRRNGNRTGPVSLLLVMLMLVAILLTASGCTDSASSSVDADTDDSPASASASPSDSSTASATATLAPSPSSTASVTTSPSTSTSASPSSASAPQSATASSSATAQSLGLEGDYLGLRTTVGMSPSTSMECYSFSADGNVELRHNGATAPTDIGAYQGDTSGWEIFWSSGRTSYVVPEGGGLRINDLNVEPIDSCLVPTSG